MRHDPSRAHVRSRRRFLAGSVAVGTLAYAPTLDGGRDGTIDREENPATTADETLSVIGGTTTTVNYSLAPVARDATGMKPDDATAQVLKRTDHGTVAELLARAAVASAETEETRLAVASKEYETAVVEEVDSTIDQLQRVQETEAIANDHSIGIQIEARWTPYPNSHLSGSVSAGAEPPPNADVHVATMHAPSGISSTHDRGSSSRPGESSSKPDESNSKPGEHRNFDDVATTIAAVFVEGYYPPEQIEAERRSYEPFPSIADHRYERAGAAYGTSVSIDDHGIRGANERLTGTIAQAIESDLRASFDDPNTAANATRTETVEIVVRTWGG